jgi:hypothetical protein
MCMKFNCVYCHLPTKNSGNIVKMCCICDDDSRFIKIDEILLGFHTDKVYLLNTTHTTVYDQKNQDLYPSLFDV